MPLESPIAIARDIDFLPASFREAGIQRKNVTLRVAVVAMFLGLIGFAAIYQQHLRLLGKDQLTKLLPQYEQAKLQTRRISELQMQLQTAEQQANLGAFLRHPWPRSQMLAALAGPLPEEMELTELSIFREPLPGADGALRQQAEPSSEANPAKIDPNQRALQTLRDQLDRTRVIVKLSGVADDAAVLDLYLAKLAHAELFTKVDVGTIERVTGGNGRVHFSARVTVRPCYGQPNGPTHPASGSTAEQKQNTELSDPTEKKIPIAVLRNLFVFED